MLESKTIVMQNNTRLQIIKEKAGCRKLVLTSCLFIFFGLAAQNKASKNITSYSFALALFSACPRLLNGTSNFPTTTFHTERGLQISRLHLVRGHSLRVATYHKTPPTTKH